MGRSGNLSDVVEDDLRGKLESGPRVDHVSLSSSIDSQFREKEEKLGDSCNFIVHRNEIQGMV